MRDKVLRMIEEAMEADEGAIEEELSLQDESWDSMATITFMALVDQNLGKTLSAEALFKCESVKDLIDLATS